MAAKLSILITGSEVLDGRVHDSNSYWLIRALERQEIEVSHVLSCDDTIEALKSSIAFLFTRSDCVIVSGGLGPTTDDLTREAIAELTGRSLLEDAETLTRIKEYFARRKRPFIASNARQALVPAGAEIIRNSAGSAPGFYLATQWGESRARKHLLTLPGVPHELYCMFNESVVQLLHEKVFTSSLRKQRMHKLMRIFGLPEALVGERVVQSAPPDAIKVSYRAAFPEVHVGYRADDLEEKTFVSAWQNAKASIGVEFIVTEEPEKSLPEVVHEILLKSGRTLALCESCTGGMLGESITSYAGASNYFKGGAVTYSNELKNQLAGVSWDILRSDGAVSAACARAMAQGVLEKFKTSLALSITGIAGPEGGSPEKPVGTFFIGYAEEGREAAAYRYTFPGNREQVRKYATYSALDCLRRKMLGLPERIQP